MIETDVVIIGAGPCGLFQVFELGLLDIRAHVVESLDAPGGQCAYLYPDKPIYDIPALPSVGAQELTDRLLEQIAPFNPVFHYGNEVTELTPLDDGSFHLVTSQNKHFHCRAVIIAGGIGSFQSVKLRVSGIEKFENEALFYHVTNPEQHRDKDIVICGGGDSALDWALELQKTARSVVLVHRRDEFRAAPASVNAMFELCDRHEMQFLQGSVVEYSESATGSLESILVHSADGVNRRLELDQLLVFFGMSPKLGPIAEWALDIQKKQILVDTEKFQTSLPGVYAVGDINHYPGKKKLILSGFHEAALAAFAIKERLNPDKKVHLQYTTTSPVMHKRLGVDGELAANG